MAPGLLAATAGLLVLALLYRGFPSFRRIAWRMRYVFLTLLLLYSCATPGRYLIPAWGQMSPTVEGVRAGGVHLLRLVVAIASLSVVLASTGRQDLLAGILFLLRPLQRLGVPVERFAVRLVLTMQYVESPQRKGLRDLLDALRLDAPIPDAAESSIVLPIHAVSIRDILALVLSVGMVILILW
jgi:energy-coupling factor transporter transmembrane protein EcfT